MENQNKSRLLPMILIVIFFGVCCAGILVYHSVTVSKENATESEYDSIRNEIYSVSMEETAVADSSEDTDAKMPSREELIETFLSECGNRSLYEEYFYAKVPSFDVLRENNSDTIGYLEIPGTEISYPILQNEDNEFYLSHSITKAANANGAIYIENYNMEDFSDSVTPVYGHHLLNGKLFGSLTDYRDAEYGKEHPYFLIYTDKDIHVYEIVLTSKYSTEHLLADAFEETDDGKFMYAGMDDDYGAKLIEKIKQYGYRGTGGSGNEVNAGDKLVILSTCCDNSTHRFLVVGKQLF